MNFPGNVAGSTINPIRGEIWQARLEPTVGSEQGKARPVVILSVAGVGRLSIRLCVPLMGYQDSHAGRAWMIRVAPSAGNGLDKLSTADAMQVRALDIQRFEARLGVLEDLYVEAVALAVSTCVGRPPQAQGQTEPTGEAP